MPQPCRAAFVRRSSLLILAASFALPVRGQSDDSAPNALLTIDMNRSTIIERIVTQWAGSMLPSGALLDAEPLRARLSGLRADRLLAASLVGSAQGLQQVLSASAASSRTAQLKSLGDAKIDLAYTPLTPCRIIDTRIAAGPLQPGVTRSEAGYTATTFAAQGGASSNCGIPSGVAALALNVVAVQPANLGFIKLWPANAAQPNASTINYDPTTTNIASGTIVPVDGANNGFNAESPAQVQMVVDVVGYFAAPTGNGGKFFMQGGNAFGTTAQLGTTDGWPLEVSIGGLRIMRYEQLGNIVGGDANNSASTVAQGQTIGGGGSGGSTCNEPTTGTNSRSCGNVTSGPFSSIGGGYANAATNTDATVVGGERNTASGIGSTVLGGIGNIALGFTSSATGRSAWANGNGCFVFGDSHTGNPVRCDADDRFVVRAEGGIFMFSGNNGNDSQAGYTGAVLPQGAQAWIAASDRAGKDHLQDVDPLDVIAKVLALNVSTWNWKSQEASIRHMGPMAQDFRAAFGLGEDDKHISTVDADGVALAAIQGLNAKLGRQIADKDARIDLQQQRIAELETRLQQLESLRGELDVVKRALSELAGVRDRAGANSRPASGR